jgi:hypothetical protein
LRTELYNYFRNYDPAVGRYVESDPIGLKGGFNTYVYVRNNALASVDPRGLRCEKCDNPVINFTFGAGGAGGIVVAGGTADSGGARDSEGNTCIYSMICGLAPPMGVMGGGGLGAVGGAGTGRLCSGTTMCIGGFRAGGAGALGNIQGLACADGSFTVSRVFGGLGEAWGGGAIVCKLTLICFSDSKCCGK